jgi:hypothetical protein
LKKGRLWVNIAARVWADPTAATGRLGPSADRDLRESMDRLVQHQYSVRINLLYKPVHRFPQISVCAWAKSPCCGSGIALAWGTYINTWEDSWDVIKRANRPNIGICLDTFKGRPARRRQVVPSVLGPDQPPVQAGPSIPADLCLRFFKRQAYPLS